MLKLKVPPVLSIRIFTPAVPAKLLQLPHAATIGNRGIFLITHGTNFLLKIKRLNKSRRGISRRYFSPVDLDCNSIPIITSYARIHLRQSSSSKPTKWKQRFSPSRNARCRVPSFFFLSLRLPLLRLYLWCLYVPDTLTLHAASWI